jgi:hypothetical protein
METVVHLSTGRVGTKIGAGILFDNKHALQWLASRYVRNFDIILQTWHSRLLAFTHLIARELKLETSHHDRNNLTAQELLLFYQKLFTFKTGIDNWKQQYAAWLLVYVTSVRPASTKLFRSWSCLEDRVPAPSARSSRRSSV